MFLKKVRYKFNINLLMKLNINLIVIQILCCSLVVTVGADNVTEPTNRHLLIAPSQAGVDSHHNNYHNNSNSVNNKFHNKNNGVNGTFKCPEQFGYYPDDNECAKYYVCVFGDALHETCTGGLYFSSELQTCDWPRNVECAHDLDSHLDDDDNRQSIDKAFNENMDQTIDEDVDRHHNSNDNNSNNKNPQNANNNHENQSNKSGLNTDNEDRDEEEVIDNEDEEEEDAEDGDQERGDNQESDEYLLSDNNSRNTSDTKVDFRSDNTYGSGFGGERAVSYDTTNGTDFYVRAMDIRRARARVGPQGDDTTRDNLIGRSADGGPRHRESSGADSLRLPNNKVNDIHGNKVNVEVDPQQPAYDEAISSVVDEMGGIHIHDGPGGTYALPTDRNHITRYEPHMSYNDKDFGFIERIAADRRPIVRVTRIRKRLRPEFDDNPVEGIERTVAGNTDKSVRNQYVPVLVMDKEDMEGGLTGKEEKVRRYRSGDNFAGNEDLSPASGVSTHFQNQRRQQQQHFRDQMRPKPQQPSPSSSTTSLSSAIPIALPNDRDTNNMEFRGFVATRNGAGKLVAIPMYKNMGNVESVPNTRRKRVRVVHRMVSRNNEDMDDIPVMIETMRGDTAPQSANRPNYTPRILVPEHSQPYLPFYGPSLTQIKKVQILPPMGPIPALKPNMELLAVFRPNHKQQTPVRPKPKPKLTEYFVINKDSDEDTSYDVLEKRVAVQSRPETTPKPAVRVQVKPKQTKRIKNKRPAAVSRHRNQTSLNTSTTRLRPQPIETTTPAFIEAVVRQLDNSNEQEVRAPTGRGQPRIKLSRNGKRLGPKDNNALQTTPPVPIRSPVQTSPQRAGVRQRESVAISNTGAQPLNNYDYYEFVDNNGVAANHTVSSYVTTIDESFIPTTTVPPPPPPQPPAAPVAKQSANKRKQSRPKKGSSALPSRPAPVYSTPALLSPAAKCTQSKCKLPDCFCGGTAIPGGLAAQDIPQMVMITFDDSVNDLNWEIYEEVFGRRLNPNGCPILGTFYVSHEWTDYGQVQTLYSQGHEMASHSITHSFGEKFSVQKWGKEVSGQREILHMYGGVALADVRGMRAPFLQGGGNKQFEMLYDLNFTYDSTMPVFENSPPFYPYTLDYSLNHECMIAPCPTKSFPGVWEVGMVMWHDLKGGRCSMGDACSNPSDEEGVHKMLLKNFNRHYQSNRAPFGLYYHSAWFNTPHHRKGFMQFIDEILTKKDVYLVTKYQMIQWMRAPTPLDRIQEFQPWQCEFDDRPPPCKNPTVCNVGSKSGSRFLKTCQPCPPSYPWVGSTGYTANTT